MEEAIGARLINLKHGNMIARGCAARSVESAYASIRSLSVVKLAKAEGWITMLYSSTVSVGAVVHFVIHRSLNKVAGAKLNWS